MAGGSGIPEVKGYLNGVRVVNTINIKSFLGKITSLIFAHASCLAIGPEGPMVHIGAIVGAGISAAKSRTIGFRLLKRFLSCAQPFFFSDWSLRSSKHFEMIEIKEISLPVVLPLVSLQVRSMDLN